MSNFKIKKHPPETCKDCGRVLKAIESKRKGYGPYCWRNHLHKSKKEKPEYYIIDNWCELEK